MKLFVKKEKKAKDPLLQTYFMSLLSLVLCVAMFMGTSFAWFTSDVASTDNQIFVGTLKVGLHQSIDGANFTEVGQTATVAEGQPNNNLILDPDVRWEPGYTFMKWLKVENAGDLEFSYRLRMSAPASEALTILGQHFVVYANTADTIAKPADFEALKQDAAWEEIGTLAEILAGKSIVNGKLDAKAKNATENPAKVFAFAIHMNENAPSEAMGKKLEGITVKLEAWQAAGGQTDSLGGNDYDDIAMVNNAEELEAAIKKGGKVVLNQNVAMKETIVVVDGSTVELELNGFTLDGSAVEKSRMFSMCTGSTLVITGDADDVVKLGGYGLVEFPAGIRDASVTLNGGKYIGSTDNGALIRPRANNENLVVNLNNVNVDVTKTWIVSTGGVDKENTMTLNVQGGSYKAMTGFQLAGTVATFKDVTIETDSIALLCNEAVVDNAKITVNNAGVNYPAEDTPAAIAVMNGKTLKLTNSVVTVKKGIKEAAAAMICSSGGNLVLDKVDFTTVDPVVLYKSTVTDNTKPSSVVATNVTHNGAAATLGE